MGGMKDTLGDRHYSVSDYPNEPGWRADGPSRAAAQKIAPAAKAIRARLLGLFVAEPAGLTTDEAARRINMPAWKIRPRVPELVASGELIETPDRRKGESGLWVTVWRPGPGEGGAK